MGVNTKDLKGILTQKEIKEYTTLKIPYVGGAEKWNFLSIVQNKVTKAIDDKKVKRTEKLGSTYKKTGLQVVSDDVDAFQSMADGKTYDSKSQYYQSLKDKGRRIVETGEKPAEPEYKTCEKELASDIKQAMDQLGY